MRRILVVDDDLHTCLAIRAWLKRCGFKVAIADDGKPFRLATLPSVIDECVSEAEPHRKHAATLAAVATTLSEQRNDTNQEIFRNRGSLRVEPPGLCVKPETDGGPPRIATKERWND